MKCIRELSAALAAATLAIAVASFLPDKLTGAAFLSSISGASIALAGVLVAVLWAAKHKQARSHAFWLMAFSVLQLLFFIAEEIGWMFYRFGWILPGFDAGVSAWMKTALGAFFLAEGIVLYGALRGHRIGWSIRRAWIGVAGVFLVFIAVVLISKFAG